MNRLLRIAVLLLLSGMGFGQTIRPVLIGIDVAKPFLSLLTPNRPAYRLGEMTLKTPISRERYLSLAGGYGAMYTSPAFRNVLIDSRGIYLKIGTEQFKSGGLAIGWHGLLTMTRESASYSFQGPTFGNLEGSVYDRRRVGVGVEGVIVYQRTLSTRLLMRVSGRATVAGMFGPRHEEIPAAFVPGVGQVAGDPVVYGLGFGLFLLYRINPRAPVSSPR